jgi:hypothetical protein
MARKDVASREYKVMLLPDRFAGDEATARLAVDAFWDELAKLMASHDIPTKGTFDEVKAHRLVRFFDTDEHLLNANRYIFRERVDVGTGEREVTLKFRHVDRYVAADRSMDSASQKDTKTKFEEDVKPPFVSVFSFSTTIAVDDDITVAELRQVADLYPGLAEELDDFPKDARLSLVRDFTARETVLVGAFLMLGKKGIEAECALVIWHDDDDPSTPPVAVEFSFKYADDEEEYGGSLARDAYRMLDILNSLDMWVHPNPVTKTAFVYG